MNMLKHFERAHIPLWIVKDMCWMMGYGELSFVFALPTIALSLILVYGKHGWERFMELMMGFWLTANTLWMCHEQFHTETKDLALIMFLCGILTFPFYLYKVKD
jgi:hypothetical protein